MPCPQGTAEREGVGTSPPPHVLREAIPGAKPGQSREVSPHLPQRNAAQDRVRHAKKPRRSVAQITTDATVIYCESSPASGVQSHVRLVPRHASSHVRLVPRHASATCYITSLFALRCSTQLLWYNTTVVVRHSCCGSTHSCCGSTQLLWFDT